MNLKTCGLLVATILVLPVAGAPAEDGESAAQDLRLKMVSFNIRYLTTRDKGVNHWKNRQTRTVETMLQFDADVIGVQEAFMSQINDMQPFLKGYQRVGVGRDDGAGEGETCSILFRGERIEAVGHGSFWLSDTPEIAGSTSWGNKVVRICTWALLRDKATGRNFYVFNTHFDHVAQPSRERSARLIAHRIARRSDRDAPFVLMGDFNADEDNPVVRYLKGRSVVLDGGDGEETAPLQVVDSFRVVKPEATEVCTAHTFTGRTVGRKIDYLFVPPGVKVEAAAIDRFQHDGLFPSDHYPVTATLVFPGSWPVSSGRRSTP